MNSCFRSSINRFYAFFLFLNIACWLGYTYFERYQTIFFWLIVFWLDIVILKNFFSKKNIRKICIYSGQQEVKISIGLLKFLGQDEIFSFHEIDFIYESEQLGRLTKGKVIRILNRNGTSIGIVTPDFLFWRQEEIDLLNNELRKYISC